MIEKVEIDNSGIKVKTKDGRVFAVFGHVMEQNPGEGLKNLNQEVILL